MVWDTQGGAGLEQEGKVGSSYGAFVGCVEAFGYYSGADEMPFQGVKFKE